MAVSKENRNTQQQMAEAVGQYTRPVQRLAMIGAVLGLVLIAVGRTDILTQTGLADYPWAPQVAAILLAMWLPISQAVSWLRTGEVQAGAITMLLAAGAAVFGNYADAGLLLSIWTLTAILRARIYEVTSKPLSYWSILAKGNWPNERLASTVARKDGEQKLAIAPGRVVPCDGIVEERPGVVSSLWHDLPTLNKEPGDLVYAGDVNLGDDLLVRPVRTAGDTALAQAVARGRAGMVPVMRRGRAPRLLRLWSLWWTIAAVVVAALAPFLFGSSIRSSLTLAMGFLALALPGAWNAAIELPSIGGTGAALRHGFLPGAGWVVEQTGRIGMLALVWDVTFGRGRRLVADVLPVKPKACSPMELLALAAAVEVAAAVEDPVSQAIRRAADNEGLSLPVAQNGQGRTGESVSATIDGHLCLVGNERFMHDHGIDTTSATHIREQLREIECRPVYCAAGGYLLGALGINEPEREEWPQIAQQLRDLGVRLVVINGDPEDGRSAWSPGRTEGMVGLLSGQEVRTIRSWGKQRQNIGLVGDAGRDHDILGQADIGIVMGPAGAVEGSGHLLSLHDNTADLPWMIKLGRRLRRKKVRALAMAISARIALAGLVLTGLAGAVQVVAIDSAVFALVSGMSLRLLGKEKVLMPHRRLVTDRRRRGSKR